VQHDAQPLGRSARRRHRERAPAALIFCLARLIRCAIVASGTRNAAAISAVVRPPTARSVSAICDGGDSAGWQHRNSSVSVSSPSARRRRRRGLGAAAALSRAPGLLAAQLVDQPPDARP
jgi:hypothetical protein